MRKFGFLVFPVFLFLLAAPAGAQLKPKQIDALVEDALEKFNVAGAAVGVVKDGKVVLAKGYGLKSVETGEKVNGQTSFAIASNTKAFTAAALAILVDEGSLGWNDHVIDHIPEFKMYNDYVTQNFNIQDLLTHRSGLSLGAGDLQIWPSGADFTIDDLLTNFQHFEPSSAFRTKYDYDNILYVVAGEVIKRVSGIPWEQFVQERILDKIGMSNSSTMPASVCGLKNLATPHMVMDGKLETIAWYEHDPSKINGALGAVLSNAEDMCRWINVQLAGGKYRTGKVQNQQLFSQQAQNEMWKIHTTINVRPNERYNPHFSGYGLGWRLSDMNGNMVVSHTGDLSGMLSQTMMLPDLNLGVVVLTNSYYGGSGLMRAVTSTIVDSYLGLEDNNWTEKYLARQQRSSGVAAAEVERVWKTVEEADAKGLELKDYTGIYKDNWFGEVAVSLEDGQLWFRSKRSPKLSGRMYYYKANAFAIKWTDRELEADAFAIFSLDEEGRAQEIKMKGVSPDIDFSYDFQDLHFRRQE